MKFMEMMQVWLPESADDTRHNIGVLDNYCPERALEKWLKSVNEDDDLFVRVMLKLPNVDLFRVVARCKWSDGSVTDHDWIVKVKLEMVPSFTLEEQDAEAQRAAVSITTRPKCICIDPSEERSFQHREDCPRHGQLVQVTLATKLNWENRLKGHRLALRNLTQELASTKEVAAAVLRSDYDAGKLPPYWVKDILSRLREERLQQQVDELKRQLADRVLP